MRKLKIALTGGPCGGKTTSIQKIEEEFGERGYKIIVVPEAATILINSGIRPFGEHSFSMLDFQKYVMDMQMYLESIAERAAEESQENTIILCDRGLMDDKAYVTKEEFDTLVAEYHTTTFELLNRYDLVLHLKTAADGKEEYYTLGNNSARTETPEEARRKAQETLHAWIGHENLKIIGNDTDFDTKMNRVIQEIHEVLDTPYPIQTQEKYLVTCDWKKLLETSPVIQKIEQYIIIDGSKKKIYRKTTKGTEIKYTLIQKQDTDNEKERITTRRNISEKEYLEQFPEGKIPIQKTRYTFAYENQYFRLDDFQDGMQILEIEDTLETKQRKFPDFLEIEEDISKNIAYRNRNLYETLNETKKEYVKK